MLRSILQVVSAVLVMALGIYIIVLPDNFLAVVTAAFALYVAFDGIRTLAAGVRFRHLPGKIVIPAFVKGLVNLVLGLLLAFFAVRNRDSLAKWMVYVIAIDILATSVVDCVELFFLSRAHEETGALGVNTALSAILAILLMIFPSITSTVFFSVAGAIVFACGVLLLYAQVNAWLVRKRYKEHKKRSLQRHTDIYDD